MEKLGWRRWRGETRYSLPLIYHGKTSHSKPRENVPHIILGGQQYFHIEVGRQPQEPWNTVETTLYCCFSQYLIFSLLRDLKRGNGNQTAEPKGTFLGHQGFVLLTFPNKLKMQGFSLFPPPVDSIQHFQDAL